MRRNCPELPAVRRILNQIMKVRKAATIAAHSDRRFAAYKYLRSVLRAYNYFVDQKLLRYFVEIAPSVLNVPSRAGCHPLRVIIEATCIQPDKRMRSRWTRALQLAVTKKIAPEELIPFIKANNGISGCADLASKLGRGPQY